MNKKVIVDYLKAKQTTALAKVAEQYDENVEALKEATLNEVELDAYAAQMQEAIDTFQGVSKALETRLNALDGIKVNAWYKPSQKVYEFAKSKNAVKDYCTANLILRSESPKFQQLKRQKDELESGIKSSYTTAIENVKACKDAKTAVEYLCGLGFNREEFELLDAPKVVTALMRPIDPRFLFVGEKATQRQG